MAIEEQSIREQLNLGLNPNGLELNLGCGTNKIAGAVNIDIEPKVQPDLVHDFILDPLPYDSDSVDKVYFFHTIEHIPKKFHNMVLGEIHRVLKPGAGLLISYPEFTKCAINFIENKDGNRVFWEATLYGRQLYPTDLHVSLMYTPHFKERLREIGFVDVKDTYESEMEPYNTVVRACKGGRPPTKEEVYIDQYKLGKGVTK